MIAEQLKIVNERISEATLKAGREEGSVRLVAVSKRFPGSVVEEAYAAGQRCFGENYVQEAEEKFREMPKDAELHLIGPLQRNKAKRCVGLFSVIESVDRLPLVKALEKQAAGSGIRQGVFMQVNVSGEASKSGSSPESISELCGAILESAHLDLGGLMSIGALYPSDTKEAIRREEFVLLRNLRGSLETEFDCSIPELSMGMSGNFELAIDEGATLVRIGTAIFGQRQY